MLAGLLSLVFLMAGPVSDVAAQRPGSSRTMTGQATVLDGQTLMLNGNEVKLWGTIAAGSPGSVEGLSSRLALEEMLGDGQVKCTIQRVMTPRSGSAICSAGSEGDLSQAMIREGFATVDRRETAGSSFAELYDGAEATARAAGAGIWRTVSQQTGWLGRNMLYLTLFGPLAGLFVLALVASRGMARLRKVMEVQIAQAKAREEEVEGRERKVLAIAIENELEENRGKVEAFITIYKELLESIRNAAGQGNHNHAGEMVHQRPALIRNVFDANIDKLPLLGIKLSGELSQFYASIGGEPEFWTLESGTSTEDAVKIVETAIKNAQALLPVIDKITGDLRTVRSAGTISQPSP